MQLVPFDLKCDEGGHKVVDVRRRGDEHSERVLAVVVPATAAGGRLDPLPAQDVRAEDRLETLRALAHDHAPAVIDRGRQASHRVEERAHVGLRLRRLRMKHRAHEEVGLDERLDLDVARALEHGRVRAYVQLDGVLAAPARAR